MEALDSVSNVNSVKFYHQTESYHGHEPAELIKVLGAVRRWARQTLFLAGDSSLDNKFWIQGDDRCLPAIGAFADVLRPPKMVADVSFYLNQLGLNRRLSAINMAAEEGTVAGRLKQLAPQDNLIRDHISKDDILAVSIGSNDVALHATICTRWYMLLLIHGNSEQDLLHRPESCWGINHFIKMFKDDVENYIKQLTSNTCPKKILVCWLRAIYYPDEYPHQGGWADNVLSLLNYNNNPTKLQYAISAIFRLATSKIQVEGAEMIPIPLFQALDGRDTNDYVARVEPSAAGGLKIAKLLFELGRLDE